MSRFSLHHGDCVDWLRSLDDESVALCVTDPAYESLEKHRAKGTTTRLKVSDASSNEWFAIFKNAGRASHRARHRGRGGRGAGHGA
jgi:site-specific DNA-methyltransferase (adenine-specific)